MHLLSTPVLASVVDASPGLAFWTLVTFGLVFFLLRWKVWDPLMHQIDEREKSILAAVDKARLEREQAEKLLAEQQKAIADARKEAGEMVRRSQAEVEKAKEQLFADAKKQADSFLVQARQQIDDERRKALAEIKDVAVNLGLGVATKLLKHNLDDAAQRSLAEDYAKSLSESYTQGAQQKAAPRAAVGA
jgi:F-type H+-transporting ATPase subunit b